MYNPPEVKQEIGDTLFCIGLQYTYETIRQGTNIIRTFTLPDGMQILAYGPNTCWFDGKKMSMYALKTTLIRKYLDKI